MKKFLKIVLYSFGGLFLLSFIVALFAPDKAKDSIDTAADSVATAPKAEVKKAPTKEEFAARLEREIEGWKKHKLDDNYTELFSFQIQVASFMASARVADSAIHHSDSKIQKLGKELKAQVSKAQVAEFPHMRKAYRKLLHDKLWEHNVETQVSGSSNSILVFTGATFANNKNKKDTQQTLHDALQLLRFKQTRYKWYEGDDEYTYYEMQTPKDSEVLTEL